MPSVSQIDKPSESQVRARIARLVEYGNSGWIRSMDAANYALNELHWSLGEELLEPYFTAANWRSDDSSKPSDNGAS